MFQVQQSLNKKNVIQITYDLLNEPVIIPFTAFYTPEDAEAFIKSNKRSYILLYLEKHLHKFKNDAVKAEFNRCMDFLSWAHSTNQPLEEICLYALKIRDTIFKALPYKSVENHLLAFCSENYKKGEV